VLKNNGIGKIGIRISIAENKEKEELIKKYKDVGFEIITGSAGSMELGEVLRSTGLVYTIVRGNLLQEDKSSGDWLVVVLYGQIGSPRRGFEHEAIGMGIQPI
jgi:hypothetical protein